MPTAHLICLILIPQSAREWTSPSQALPFSVSDVRKCVFCSLSLTLQRRKKILLRWPLGCVKLNLRQFQHQSNACCTITMPSISFATHFSSSSPIRNPTSCFSRTASLARSRRDLGPATCLLSNSLVGELKSENRRRRNPANRLSCWHLPYTTISDAVILAKWLAMV